MKSYIVLTSDGWTYTPKDEIIENLQVLGFVHGNSPDDALNRIKEENPHLEETGFEEVILMELKNKEMIYRQVKL